MPRVETRVGWMQGAARWQWSSIAKRRNAADADPGLNPKGRCLRAFMHSGCIAALRVAHLEQPNFAPHALHCIPQATGAGHDSY